MAQNDPVVPEIPAGPVYETTPYDILENNLSWLPFEVSMDVETTGLEWDAQIIGYSIANGPFSRYIPVGHDTSHPESQPNSDHERVKPLIQALFDRASRIWWANSTFDIGRLLHAGYTLKPNHYCVFQADHLIDENCAHPAYSQGFRSLDLLAKKFNLAGKDEEMVTNAMQFLGCSKNEVMGNLQKLPPQMVAPYAKQDALIVEKLRECLLPLVVAENQERFLKEGAELALCIAKMTRRGFLTNGQYRQESIDTFAARLNEGMAAIGISSIHKKDDIEAYRLRMKAAAPGRTPKGQLKFDKEYLEEHLPEIARLRNIKKNMDYLEGFLEFADADGVVHPTFNISGTRTTRLSSDHPNVQNMPARSASEESKAIRKCMVARPGSKLVSIDYSQMEPRFSAHLGIGNTADEMIAAYAENPGLSVYDFITARTSLDKATAKKVALARNYSAGATKIAETLGVSKGEAINLINQYEKAYPFLKPTSAAFANLAGRLGYVTLWNGRRLHFPHYGKTGAYGKSNMSKEEAIKQYGADNICVANTYTAYNSAVQGGTTQIVLGKIRELFRDLYVDQENVSLLLQVHDELVFEIRDELIESMVPQIVRVMESNDFMRVPLRVAVEVGPNWGECQPYSFTRLSN